MRSACGLCTPQRSEVEGWVEGARAKDVCAGGVGRSRDTEGPGKGVGGGKGESL